MSQVEKLVKELNVKSFRWDIYRGTGKGGQKRNKTENCVRCLHEESQAYAVAEAGRSKDLNKKAALIKIIEHKLFKDWVHRLLFNLKGEKRNYRIGVKVNELHFSESKVQIFDLGRFMPVRRKAVKRAPVEKSRKKIQRRIGKKIIRED